MAKRPSQKQRERLLAECKKIQSWRLEPEPIGKVTAGTIGKITPGTIGKLTPQRIGPWVPRGKSKTRTLEVKCQDVSIPARTWEAEFEEVIIPGKTLS